MRDTGCRFPSTTGPPAASPTRTPAEQAFIDEVARICERERIDVIYPSWDPNFGMPRRIADRRTPV
jgi:hypothetical protein